MNIFKIIEKHANIALQFSGGRDSLACLYLMRPYWDRITVYWTDTGDAYPETLETIEKIIEMVPKFAVIEGNQPKNIEEHGIPTDILPASSTPMGVIGSGKGNLMQDRYSCCLRSIMLPMHQRMHKDGITLIIRGQKNDDRLKSVVRSGDVLEGIEYLFPIEDWDNNKVMEYLRVENAPIPRFYEMLNSAPDCMSCSAYWEEGSMSYLKRYHHNQYQYNLTRLDMINKAVSESISAFNKEIGS